MAPDSFLDSVSGVIVTESRHECLLRLGKAQARFLQGVFPFAGRGVFQTTLLDPVLAYVVPPGHVAQIVYFRAGNHSSDLLYLTLTANESPVRYFPVSAGGDVHVPLAIVENYPAGTELAICIGAPRGLQGTVVLDVGILEMGAADA